MLHVTSKKHFSIKFNSALTSSDQNSSYRVFQVSENTWWLVCVSTLNCKSDVSWQYSGISDVFSKRYTGHIGLPVTQLWKETVRLFVACWHNVVLNMVTKHAGLTSPFPNSVSIALNQSWTLNACSGFNRSKWETKLNMAAPSVWSCLVLVG